MMIIPNQINPSLDNETCLSEKGVNHELRRIDTKIVKMITKRTPKMRVPDWSKTRENVHEKYK